MQILAYLKATSTFRFFLEEEGTMTLRASSNQTLPACVDFGWANDAYGFISVTGFLI